MKPEVFTQRSEQATVMVSLLPSMHFICSHITQSPDSKINLLQCPPVPIPVRINWHFISMLKFLAVCVSRRMVGGWCRWWLYMCMFVHTCSPHSLRKTPTLHAPRHLQSMEIRNPREIMWFYYFLNCSATRQRVTIHASQPFMKYVSIMEAQSSSFCVGKSSYRCSSSPLFWVYEL